MHQALPDQPPDLDARTLRAGLGFDILVDPDNLVVASVDYDHREEDRRGEGASPSVGRESVEGQQGADESQGEQGQSVLEPDLVQRRPAREQGRGEGEGRGSCRDAHGLVLMAP